MRPLRALHASAEAALGRIVNIKAKRMAVRVMGPILAP
jgi:hypothetical protein